MMMSPDRLDVMQSISRTKSLGDLPRTRSDSITGKSYICLYLCSHLK